MNPLTEKNQHLPFVDGLRGIAILLVLGNHWTHYFWESFQRKPWSLAISSRLMVIGNTGVILFFVVSAFTLYHSLMVNKQPGPLSTQVSHFYIRRFFRIVPLLWLSLLLYALLQGRSVDKHVHCFLLYCSLSGVKSHLFTPGWTLMVEETFYLMLPFLFPFIRRALAVVALLAGTFLVRWAWFRWGMHMPSFYDATQMQYFPLAHWYCFGLGIALYFLYRKIIASRWQNARWWRHGTVGLATGAVIIWLGKDSWGEGDVYSALALSLLVIATFPKQSWFRILCEWRWLRGFGVCCYSIYLFHLAVIQLIREPVIDLVRIFGIETMRREVQVFATFPIVALIMLGVGWVSLWLFEKPFVRLGKRLIENSPSVSRNASRRTPKIQHLTP